MASATEQTEPGTEQPEVVLVSAMRNEGPFILEWVAYHRVIGIDRIVILSNVSDDGTEEILSTLAAAGEIIHYHVDPKRNHAPQSEAGRIFREREGYSDGTWYLWLDADEFLNIHVGGRRLPDLIGAMGNAAGIHLNWRIFGTSGNSHFTGRFVSSDFSGASAPNFRPNRETKSLFRKGNGITGFDFMPPYRPRLSPNHGLTPQDFLAGNGQPLIQESGVTMDWLAGKGGRRTNVLLPSETGWALAQINHYSVRTPEFYALKGRRGRGAAPTKREFNTRHTGEYFNYYDRNDESDLSIAFWEGPTTSEIARLRTLPGVEAALEQSEALVAQILAHVAVSNGGELTRIVRIEPPQQNVVPAQAAMDSSRIEGKQTAMSELKATVETELKVAEAPSDQSSFKLTFANAEAAFVRRVYGQAGAILEYGSGGSTVLAAELGKHVVSVESDKAWAARLTDHLASISDKAKVHHADIGPTGAWGAPARARDFRKFHTYALSVWDRPDFQEPDLVLIDGRFRASCLVAVMLRTKKPVTVLFDDYRKRGYYHGVEKLARKEEMIGRMARFTVTPGAIPPDMVTEAIGWFTDQR